MFELIHGVGKVLGKHLSDKYGEPKSIDQAIDILANEVGLPKSTQQDISLRPWHIIPRSVIEHLEDDLRSHLAFKFEIAGSYRRGLMWSGDIDLVIVGDSTEIYNQLCSIKTDRFDFNTSPYMLGPDKISLFVRLPYMNVFVTCDMFFVKSDEYPYMLFYATGSKEFNIRMRRLAKSRGGLLNQSCLILDGVKVYAETEQDIMLALGLDYLEPSQRVR